MRIDLTYADFGPDSNLSPAYEIRVNDEHVNATMTVQEDSVTLVKQFYIEIPEIEVVSVPVDPMEAPPVHGCPCWGVNETTLAQDQVTETRLDEAPARSASRSRPRKARNGAGG